MYSLGSSPSSQLQREGQESLVSNGILEYNYYSDAVFDVISEIEPAELIKDLGG